MGLSRRGSRFVSDALAFTGTDLGDRHGAVRRRQLGDTDSDEEGYSTDDVDDAEEDGLAMLDPQDREDILVQSAMARIQRAQAKGRADVNLSKAELEALERRRRRTEEEAEKRERRRRREHRISVPLTQIEPMSRHRRSGRSSEASSRHPSVGDLPQVLPPMGHFPPPSLGPRTRPRSGTSVSQRSLGRVHDDHGYEYVQRPMSAIAARQTSDSMSRPPSRSFLADEPYSQYSGGGREDPDAHDPFQFQTAGPRVVAAAAALARRPPSSAGASGSIRSTRSNRRSVYEESSDDDFIPSEEGSSVSDEQGNGARIREAPPRGRESAIVIEESPEPERSSPKKKESSPVKRKPVASRGKKKRR